MPIARLFSRALLGIDAPLITIEVDLAGGLPAFTLVGLPEASVREARERVRSALLNAGFDFPARRITVNLAPADLASANQDTQGLEQSLESHALPIAATALAPAAASAWQPASRERQVALQTASARQVASQDCRPVKASKSAGKSRKAKAPVCQPLQAKAAKTAAGKASLRAAGANSSKAVKSAKSSKVRQAKAGSAAKSRAKSSGKKNTQVAQKRPKS